MCGSDDGTVKYCAGSCYNSQMTGDETDLTDRSCIGKSKPECRITNNVNSTLCAQCTNTTHYLNTTESICTEVTKVQDCKYYSSSDDSCSECETGFYLDGNVCKRYTEVENCYAYSGSSDVCSFCKLRYYYDSGQKKCLKRTNFDSCREFTINNDNCDACEENRYQDSETGKCERPLRFIPNCRMYATATTCMNCFERYSLIELNCDKITASNCLESSELDKCTSRCETKYRIGKDTKCVLKIEGCSSYDTADKCKRCDVSTGYFAIDITSDEVENKSFSDPKYVQVCKKSSQISTVFGSIFLAMMVYLSF